MGLRDLFWPSNEEVSEHTVEQGAQQEADHGAATGSEPGVDPAEAAGMNSGGVDGVMDSSSSTESSEGQKVLSTDESPGLDEEQQPEPGEHGTVHGIDGDNGQSGKSVEGLLSGDLGEEPVEEQEEQKDGEEEKQEEELDDRLEEEEENGFSPDTLRSSKPETSQRQRHGENDDTFMELPQVCVTEQETPDPDASAEEMIPEALPGWDLQKTDRYRWQMDNALDYINATYRDPLDRRYMFHVSKWKPRHVQYALDNLYGFGEPNSFDIWTARGQFVFAVKIAGGTVDNAKTLLMAAPALSKSYFQTGEGSR